MEASRRDTPPSMERVAVFLAAVIPALLLLGYGVAKVRASWRSEALWTAFFLGASGALAAAFGEFFLLYLLNLNLLPPLLDAAATALLIAAIPEETIKFIMLVGPAERHVDARRVQDIL